MDQEFLGREARVEGLHKWDSGGESSVRWTLLVENNLHTFTTLYSMEIRRQKALSITKKLTHVRS